jgi:hypothetical protein
MVHLRVRTPVQKDRCSVQGAQKVATSLLHSPLHRNVATSCIVKSSHTERPSVHRGCHLGNIFGK